MQSILCWLSNPATPERGTLKCAWCIQWHLLGKINFPFLMSCQLQIASRWGLGLVFASFDNAGTLPGLTQCRASACVLPQSLWVYTCIDPAVSTRSCFPGVIHHVCLRRSPEPWGHGFDEDMPVRSKCPEVSNSLCMAQLWVSVLSHSYCNKKLLWWGLNKL